MSLVGRQIGRYRILEELGSGGMSVVYKGLDTALDREVAVKVLHPHLSGKDESRRRLAREAKAVAKLRHPNILEVFDFSTVESEDAYLITEYIRGQTLRQFCQKEPFFPPELAAMAIHEISAALAHAHEAGVIHRDLKPENVMVREDGLLKLMDFGIAKIIDRDDKMTMTGALVGSPAHMAPEIIEGLEAGPEADVFSLGTMLYLLAVGQLPFQAANTTATLKKILDCTYDDPRRVCAAVSDELAEVISRCLLRSPQARYSNAGKLRDALMQCLQPLGLERPHEELGRYFAAPAAYRAELTRNVTDRVLASAEELLKGGRAAKALSRVNHALGLEPENARAKQLLDQMTRERSRQRTGRARRRGALFATAGAAAVGLFIAIARADHPAPKAMAPAPPAEVAVAPVAPVEPPTAIEEPSPNPEPLPPARDVARPRPARLPVSIQVRPFAFIQVDDGPKSAEALSEHRVQLLPGAHTVKITCQVCDPSSEAIDVPASATDEPFRLVARPKAARLIFDADPPDAVVRVGSVERAAKDTANAPIEVALPRGSFLTQVEYTVQWPGQGQLTGQLSAKAGERQRVAAKLPPP